MARQAQTAARARRERVLRDTRRGLIVDAARRLFAEHGLDGTSMRAIALEAGCTTGAIYPHFAGKEALYAAVLSESLAALHGTIAAAMADAPDRPTAGLRAFFTFYRERPDELALGLYLYRGIRPAGLNADLDRRLNRQLADAFGLIEAACRQSGDSDAKSRTATGIAQAIGLLILERTGRLKLFDRAAETLLEGYLTTAWSDEP